MRVHVVSGALQNISTVVDQYLKGPVEGSASTSHNGASITNTNANDYIMSLWTYANQGGTISETDGFTFEQNLASPDYACSADRVVSSTGTYMDTISSSVSQQIGNLTASFKAATGTTYQPYWMMGILD